MKATDILAEEHRVIVSVLDSLESAANRLLAGEAVPADFFLTAADFIKNFADGSHHKKEERILFAALEVYGLPQSQGPVGVMLAEHEDGRRFTRAMYEGAERVQAGDDSAKQQVIQNALGYVALLRQHIQKEDHILFPMAEQVIPVEQHQQVLADFNHVENDKEVHKKYIRLAKELAGVVKDWGK